VGAGCCVSCCQYRYSGDSVPLEMEVDLKVGCSRSLVCMTTYMTGVWGNYTSGVFWRGPGVSNISVSLSAQFEGIRQWRRSYVRYKSSRHVEYNIVSMGSIFFNSRIGVSDLVPLLKMPTILENSLFSAWSLRPLISPVKSPVSRTASRHLGEANGDA
jgi:hypothetical protein